MNKKWEIRLGDSLELLRKLPDQHVHLILTDPPYFIDGMGDTWDRGRLNQKASQSGVVGSLRIGMRCDPSQGKKFQAFMNNISLEAYRVLKPGGFYIAFSQARLYHRLAIAIEESGFEIRDMLGWKYQGQAKAFSMDHFVKKMKLSEAEKADIIQKLEGRKTPQLKPEIEPMVLAQKPKQGTFIMNWLKYETGLVNVKASLDGKFPGNIMEVKKPSKEEKGVGNQHLTVKPVALLKHLIHLFSKEGQIVLDPFNGSGSTGIACVQSNRYYIGIEIDPMYVKISKERIKNAI